MMSDKKDEKNNKIIIYTAIFGGKDKLNEPEFISPDCDYVCFTDSDLQSRIWKIKKVKPEIKNDSVRSAKVYKILPHKYFPDYDCSVWVDGNLLIKGDVTKLIDKYLKELKMAAFDHANYKSDPGHTKLQMITSSIFRKFPYARHCAYEEARELIISAEKGKQKDDPEIIKKQMIRYREEGYPENNSLIQGAFLIRKHNDQEVVKVMKDWWGEIINYSRRDQLCFNYVAWKNNFKFNYIKGDPRKNKFVFRMPHQR